MENKELICELVLELDNIWFESVKSLLTSRCLSFSFAQQEEITRNVLAEKLCDFFDKVEIKAGKSFDKLMISYMSDIDEMVGKRIAETPKARKGQESLVEVPRARKYYEKALSYKTKTPDAKSLLNYTRLMMCLYSAIIDNKYQVISNFNYSSSSIDVGSIIHSVENEKASGFLQHKKNLFDLTDKYGIGTSAFILLLLLLTNIKNNEFVEGN